jgi:hypothetical protein
MGEEGFASLAVNPQIARETYLAARPWAHLVIDDVISCRVAQQVTSEVDNLPSHLFTWQRSRRIQKASLSSVKDMGPRTRQLIDELQGDDFVASLGALAGIPGLSADPGMAFAGIYVTPPGGWQRVHEDFSQHPRTRLWNRVAVLLYISEWQPGDGGELELWDGSVSGPPVLVEPLSGRMVIFETSARTLHGIRAVVAGSRSRLALGARYYAPTPPDTTPRRLLSKTVRRPGERLIDVLPTIPEALKLLWRLDGMRRDQPEHTRPSRR